MNLSHQPEAQNLVAQSKVTVHMLCLQRGASDELYRMREKTAEEILKAESTAAQDTEKVTGLYRGYAHSPYGQPAALEHAQRPVSSQVRI